MRDFWIACLNHFPERGKKKVIVLNKLSALAQLGVEPQTDYLRRLGVEGYINRERSIISFPFGLIPYSRGEAGEDGWRPSKEVLINPDSPIRLIYCYIQQTFEIDCDLEWDLCDESGNLVFMYDKEPWMNGMNYLVPKSTYMVVLFERDAENRLANPMLYLHESLKKSSNMWSELMSKIRKQINPGLAGKASRRSKSRSNTSYAK